MYKGKKVSIVFPAYNEEKNIAKAIDDFQKLHIFDQIIVVDNNSKDKTAKIASQKGVQVVSEKKQGYGFALRKGIQAANGDYIFLCEPDGTFLAKDSLKLLEHINHYDVVIGTRTNKKFIGEKANMKGLLRLGNIILAKLIQLLYRPSCSLSDCGCTFRVMKKNVVKKILPQVTVGGSHFLSELLVLILKTNFTVYEIPVHYNKRVGESKITGSLKRSILVGVAMLQIVIKNKQKLLFWVSIFSVLFSLAIAINVSPFLRGPAPYTPDWRWDYSPTPLSIKIFVPLLIIIAIFAVIYRYDRNEVIKKFNAVKVISILFLLGFLFQLTLLYASRTGIAVLLQRIINPTINGYFTVSLTNQTVNNFFYNFNATMGSYPMYAKFHPPGAILFFSILNTIAANFSFLFPFINKLMPQHADVATVWRELTNAQKLSAFYSGFIISLLSYITIIPLYLSGNLLYGRQVALRSVFIYLFIPSVLLFIPLNDSFLPLFTVLSLYFFLLGIKTKKLIFSFLSGVSLFFGTFFSLTFLPLVLFFFIFLFLQKFQKYFLNLFLSFLVGFLLLPFFLLIFYQFNFITMTEKMMKFHIEAQTGRKYWVWLFYNLYDFFMFIGIPIALLFFYKIKKLLHDRLYVAFLLTLFIVDLTGSVRGETARIWLPFVPLVILPIANFVTNICNFSPKQFRWLIVLQIIQVFIFQLFLVTLW